MELRTGAALPPLAAILSSVLATPMICFTTKAGGASGQPFVAYAGSEVMPGASLADVLFEEFGIEISDQTIVMVEPFGMSDSEGFSSQDLGQALGQIIVDLAELNHAEPTPAHTAGAADFAQQSQPSADHRLMAS